ncbi:MAG TPA: hypothetical protein VGR22_08290 [Thermomicrobiales bacterium]|nr:hypothetical protein [Thermomicrobiales bacterium]
MDTNATGSSRLPFRRPTIVVGTESTLLGHPIIAPNQATQAGFYALDLDLRRAWDTRIPGTLADHAPAACLRSAWIPRQYTGPWREARAVHLREFLTDLVESYGLRTVIVPSADGTRQRGTSLGQLAREVMALGGLRVAMRVGPELLLAQPGSHLDHVANLRRMAEEWDLDLALDLTAPGIEGWEAEATLMRLFPRLTMVRIRPLHSPDGARSQEPNARIGLRSIAMLADQAYNGVISIAPSVSPLTRWIPAGSRVLVSTALTREEVLAAWDRVDQYDITTWQKRQQFG